MKYRIFAISFGLLVSISMGCGGCFGEEEDPGPPLECEERGFPCDYDESATDAVQLSSDYLDAMASMHVEGATTAELARWVSEQPEVVEVWSAPAGFRFRVEGAAPMWFIDTSLAGGLDDGTMPTMGSTNPYVVGHHRDDEAEKKALFLRPFSELASNDRQWVMPLEESRDYEEVDFLVDEEADYQAFGSFSDYDTILVNTHGVTVCEPKGDAECEHDAPSDWFDCRSRPPTIGPRPSEVKPTLDGARCEVALGTGDVVDGCSPDVVSSLPPGVQCSFHSKARLDPKTVRKEIDGTEVECGELQGEYRFLATSEYFRNKYKGREKNKFIMFGACQLFVTTVLRDVIGEDNVVFGWTNAVLTSHSAGVRDQIMERAVSKGETSTQIRNALGDVSNKFDYPDPHNDYVTPLCSEYKDDGTVDDDKYLTRLCDEEGADKGECELTRFEAYLYHHAPDDDLRVRELVTAFPRDGILPYADGSAMEADPGDGKTQIYIEIKAEHVDEYVGDMELTLDPFDIDVEWFKRRELDPETSSYLIPATIHIDEVLEGEHDAKLELFQELEEGGKTRHTADVIIDAPAPCDWEVDVAGRHLSGPVIMPQHDDGKILFYVGQDPETDKEAGGSIVVEAGQGATGNVTGGVSVVADNSGRVFITPDEMPASVELHENSASHIDGEMRGTLAELVAGEKEARATYPFTGSFRWTEGEGCEPATGIPDGFDGFSANPNL